MPDLSVMLADAGTADPELLVHALRHVTDEFDPAATLDDLTVDGWETLLPAVRQHVLWHTDVRFTCHAMPGGLEQITRGTALGWDVVYEGGPGELG